MADRQPEIINRVTREGRRLQYELKVIQQPERARACGSGAKCKNLSISQLLIITQSTNNVQHPPTDDLLIHHLLLN